MPNITNLRRTNGGITYYEEDGEIFEVTQNPLGKPASIQSRRGKWTEEKSVFSYDTNGRFLGLTGDIETTLLPALMAEATGTASYATDPLTGAVTGLVWPGGGNVLHVLGATNGQVFGDTRYPGQLIDSLSSLSGWVQTVTGGATITTTTMKDGNPGIQFTLAAGSSTAYIDKVGLSINYTQDTTIGIWVEIPDAGRIAGINICVSNENNAFTNWNHGSAGGSGGAV